MRKRKNLFSQTNTLSNGIKLNPYVIWNKSSFNKHSIICGSTGRGKTNLIYQIMFQRAAMNSYDKVIYLNGKYDVEMANSLKYIKDHYCNFKNLDIKIIDSRDSKYYYDIFKNKSLEEILVIIVEYEDFTKVNKKDPSVGYYRTKEKELISHLTTLLKTNSIGINFPNIIKYCSKKGIDQLINKLNCHEDKINYWKNLFSGFDKDLYLQLVNKFQQILNISCFSNFSPEIRLSISKFLNDAKTNILVFNLDTINLSGANLGKLITLDLKQTLQQKSLDQHVMVIMDEFGSFATDQIQIMLQQFRSFNVEMVLSFQGFSQLDKISKDFKDDIVNNAFNIFAFNMLDSSSAEYASKLFGTKKVHELTVQTENAFETGKGSKKMVDEFYVHPNDFKMNLKVGECYFRTLDKNGNICPPIKIKINEIQTHNHSPKKIKIDQA